MLHLIVYTVKCKLKTYNAIDIYDADNSNTASNISNPNLKTRLLVLLSLCILRKYIRFKIPSIINCWVSVKRPGQSSSRINKF